MLSLVQKKKPRGRSKYYTNIDDYQGDPTRPQTRNSNRVLRTSDTSTWHWLSTILYCFPPFKELVIQLGIVELTTDMHMGEFELRTTMWMLDAKCAGLVELAIYERVQKVKRWNSQRLDGLLV